MTTDSGGPRRSPVAAYLGATSLLIFKPVFRRWVRPMAAWLCGLGVHANQVTLASLAGSLAVAAFVCKSASHPTGFVLLAIWLWLRTALAALDGTMAIEFGQKTRLGGRLNEAGDIISEAALLLPFALVDPRWARPLALLAGLSVATEFAGMLGSKLGSERRVEGPLGKADRSILLTLAAVIVAVTGRLPQPTPLLISVLSLGLVMTTVNRLRFALAR